MNNQNRLFALLLSGYKVHKKYYMTYILLMIVFGLSVPVFIELQKRLIDTAIVTTNEFASLGYILIPLLIGYFIFYYLDTISTALTNYLQTNIFYKVEHHLVSKLMSDLSKFDYYAYEDSDIQNTMMRVSTQKSNIYLQGITFIPNVLKAIIELGTIFIFMIISGVWWAFPLGIVTTIPAFYFNKKRTQYARLAFSNDSKDVRYADYLNDTILNKESAKERRFFGFYHYLSNLWDRTFTKYHSNKMKTYIKSSVATGIAMSFSMSVILIVALALIGPLENGAITIGLYTALLTAVSGKMNNGINTIMREYTNIRQMNYFIEDVNTLKKVPKIEKQDTIKELHFESLEFKDVWFAYPKTDDYILKGVSFTIRRNEQHALIGVNGAGKTTITKLMLGLYTPTKGTIYLNGENIKHYHYHEIQTIYAAIEQNFAKYKGDLVENIALYNLSHAKVNENQLNETLSKCNTTDLLNRCENSYRTNLSPELNNGIMLSGGEWQKVAISRALFSKRDFLIFDEPTAALDPIAEVAFYDTYQKMMKGHTCLFITHRLGSVYLFDNCFVLNDGKITEQGSHQSLMSHNGVYQRLYEKQKKWYQTSTEGDVNEDV